MTFEDWCNHTSRDDRGRFPHITCKDGFSFSCQGSRDYYCEPEVDHPFPFLYKSFELGFPSEGDEIILPYTEYPWEPTETVYGWVPKAVVGFLVEKHGGIVEYSSKNYSTTGLRFGRFVILLTK
jgi:hypothetical protein